MDFAFDGQITEFRIDGVIIILRGFDFASKDATISAPLPRSRLDIAIDNEVFGNAAKIGKKAVAIPF